MPSRASRSRESSVHQNRLTAAVVRRYPRLRARQTAAPIARRNLSRRGGGSPQHLISLRAWSMSQRSAFVVFLMGKLDHDAPEGRAVVSIGALFGFL